MGWLWARNLTGWSPATPGSAGDHSAYTTLVDFAADGVVAAVVRQAAAHDRAAVLGVGRRLLDPVPHAPHQLPGGETLLERCEQAISEAEDAAGVIPRQAVFSLRGELVRGGIETGDTERPRPDEPISAAEVRQLVAELVSRAAPEARARLRRDSAVGWDAVPLEPVIVATRLDGRSVPTVVGLTGASLALSVFLAWAPQVLDRSIRDLAEQLDLEVQAVRAGACAAGRGAALAAGVSAGTVVDVAGATTDIAVVRHRAVVRSGGFSLGTAAWTRRVATHLGCSIDEALRLRRAASAGSLRGPRLRQLRQLAAEDLALWLATAEVALTDLSELTPLPAQIVLTGDATAIQGVRSLLLRHRWAGTVRFDRRVTVRVPRGLPGGQVQDRERLLQLPQEAGLVGLGMQTLESNSTPGRLVRIAATPTVATT